MGWIWWRYLGQFWTPLVFVLLRIVVAVGLWQLKFVVVWSDYKHRYQYYQSNIGSPSSVGQSWCWLKLVVVVVVGIIVFVVAVAIIVDLFVVGAAVVVGHHGVIVPYFVANCSN